MISEIALTPEGAEGQVLGPLGSGEPSLRSFVSGWRPWSEIEISIVPVGFSERFKNVWMGPSRYLPRTR
jgi:hypothetical protein